MSSASSSSEIPRASRHPPREPQQQIQMPVLDSEPDQEVETPPSTAAQLTIIVGMLLSGTLTTLSSKLLLETRSVGLDGVPKPFTKPWFLVLTMFLAMSFSLIVYYADYYGSLLLLRVLRKRKRPVQRFVLGVGAPDRADAESGSFSSAALEDALLVDVDDERDDERPPTPPLGCVPPLVPGADEEEREREGQEQPRRFLVSRDGKDYYCRPATLDFSTADEELRGGEGSASAGKWTAIHEDKLRGRKGAEELSADRTSSRLRLGEPRGRKTAGPPRTSRPTAAQYVLQCGFPAVCDLLATGLGSMGLVYVAASVFAMFRGLNIVMTAVLSYWCLGRVLARERICGLALVMLAMLVVGWSAEGAAESGSARPGSGPAAGGPGGAGAGGSTHSTSDAAAGTGGGGSTHRSTSDAAAGGGGADGGRDGGNVFVGAGLILLGQVCQGAQYVWMERVMKDARLDITPLFLVGAQGLCGFLLLLFVGYPILAYLPGADTCTTPNPDTTTPPDGQLYDETRHLHPCLESLNDTVTMLWNSPVLQFFLFWYMAGILLLNFLAVTCTKYLSCVVTALVTNGLRTAAVWVLGLAMYQMSEGGAAAPANGGVGGVAGVTADGRGVGRGETAGARYGEPWNGMWSWLQAAGFSLYIAGMLLYMETT